jgi:hypothetical protein
MALENPLHRIDTANIETEAPAIPWQKRDFDGYSLRNVHERALADRDVWLLGLIKTVKDHGGANVSPQFPFTETATMKPSQAVALDNVGDVMAGFTVDPAPLKLSTSFLADLKLILSNEFREPYISTMVLRKALDTNTSLVQIFVDLEISARYTGDQQDHVILALTGKAFNDVQDNTNPSSRDDIALTLTPQTVDGREWLNSGVVRFAFIGSVQSSLSTSWSVGLYNNAMVEGFSTLPTLERITFAFTRPATELTELAYNLLGDLQSAVPFLDKIKNYPFDIGATAGQILAKYILDINVSGPPVAPVYIKRIRIDGSNYIFLLAYNEYDSLGNYLGTVNIGVATLTPTSANKITVSSLGSNRVAGVSPTWLDEVPTTGTTDNYGNGTLKVKSYADMASLFAELISAPVTVGSPSPIDVSPVSPEPIVGLYADPTMIEMVESNSYLDSLALDIQGTPVSVYNRPLSSSHTSPNVQVSIGGVLVNRRTCYGQEALMRDFYGIASSESLIDNPKIPLEDQWYDTTSATLKVYQFIQGKRRWRTL